MALFGLIGFPLSHSWSEQWFNKKLGEENPVLHEYRVFPLSDISDLKDLVEQYPRLEGLNVTIPHKVSVIPMLDELDAEASAIGAVNVIHIIREHGKTRMKGYNTDAPGFIESADFSGHSHAFILGTGGAAKAVDYVLKKSGIRTLLVSRHPVQSKSIGYPEINRDLLGVYTLVVNATPLGMFPETASCPPFPYELLDRRHFLYDLVYNPEMTTFLAHGKKAGSRIMNGMKMLQLQAEKSLRIWMPGK